MSGKSSKLKRMHARAAADAQEATRRVDAMAASLELAEAQRVAAQRGLVRYMKLNGLGHRIGFDPDNDQPQFLKTGVHNDQNSE